MLAPLAVSLAIGGPWLFGALLDSNTSVPIGFVLGSAGTVFLVGMWVSAKVTRFEEQQITNTRRLDVLEERLSHLEKRR